MLFLSSSLFYSASPVDQFGVNSGLAASLPHNSPAPSAADARGSNMLAIRRLMLYCYELGVRQAGVWLLRQAPWSRAGLRVRKARCCGRERLA